MLEICSVLIFAAHLVLVDVAMVGPLACWWLARRGRRTGDALATRLAENLTVDCLLSLFGAIVLGVALLGLMWQWGDRAYFAAIEAIPTSRLWFGLGELGFYFVCMTAYRWLVVRDRARLVQGLLALAAASNLMLHFPPLFAVIATLSGRGPLSGAPLDRAGWYKILLDAEVMSRVVHVWLASAAVVGLLIVVRARRAGLPDDASAGSTPQSTHLAATGARLALVATLLQIPVGLWLLLALPEANRLPLMGGDLSGTLMFGTSLVLTLVLMHYLVAVALGDPAPSHVRRAIVLMLGVVTLMVGTLHRIEQQARANWSARAELIDSLETLERPL